MKNRHQPKARNLRRIAVAAAATITPIVAVAGSTAALDPPPWILCAYADHPVAADLGALVPFNVTPPPEAQAVLRGEVAIGTDCAVYDLPV
jgi:hypothetical protein